MKIKTDGCKDKDLEVVLCLRYEYPQMGGEVRDLERSWGGNLDSDQVGTEDRSFI